MGDHRRLHDLLRELRRRAGEPSLRKINGASGVSVGYLSQIFAGKTAPGPDVAVRVAQALHGTDREQARVRFYAEGTGADRSAQRPADTDRGHRAGWAGCPYLGLRPFEEQHASIFYGRRALTARLLDRLREQPADAGLLLVLGPSGAGKSSLLRAGLLGSAAADGLAPGSGSWPRRVITPTGDPVGQLAVHLADLAGADAISVRKTLTTRPGQAHLLAGQALAAAGGGARLMVVVDQLEELFTLTTDAGERETFLTALHSLATEPVLPGGQAAALVVAGIRGDFLDQALAFPPVRQAAEAGVFAVGAMSESELREAIVGPAAEAGIRIPDDLCAAVLDDLRERGLPVGFDCGALPLLSQVMFVMWHGRDSGGLTVAGYRRTGGVADIVHTTAEQVYDGLSPHHQDLARRALTHLTATTDGRLTRRPSTRSALRDATRSDETARVVEAFAAQRLLIVSDSDQVTIAHEELLRSWSRLRDWIQPDLTDRALHQALTEGVQTWERHHHSPSYLYRGEQLLTVMDAVRRWTGDPHQHLPVEPATLGFLQAGQRRARRQRHAYQAVTAALVLLLLVTGTTAVLMRRNAIRAEHNATRAEQQHAVALSRSLAAASRAGAGANRAVAEQLAAAALHLAPTDEALAAVSGLLGDARSVLPNSWSAQFSQDGKLLATIGEGGVRLWDPRLGQPVGPPLPGDLSAFSRDGKLLAVGELSGPVRLYEPSTGQPVGQSLATGSHPMSALLFGAGGQLLVLGDEEVPTQLWNPGTGRQLFTLQPGVVAGQFSPDGTLLALAHSDGRVRLWNPRTGRPAGPALTGHTGPVRAVAFSPDGKLLLTGGEDQTARLWDPGTGRTVVSPLTAHGEAVEQVAFSPDGKLLATSDTEEGRLWDPATGQPAGPAVPGLAALFSPGGKLLVTDDDRTATTMQMWDPATRQATGALLTGPDEPVEEVAFSPDGEFLAIAYDNGTLLLSDQHTGRPAGGPLTGLAGPVGVVAVSPDGKVVVAASGEDATVQVWDARSGRPVAPLGGHQEVLTAVAFSPDGTMLATADAKTVRLWDTRTWRPTGTTLPSSIRGDTQVAFSPDSQVLASDGGVAVRLWDPGTGRLLGTTTAGPAKGVRAAAFSPDGSLLVTTAVDGAVRRWDPRNGQPVGPPMIGHTGDVGQATFDRRGDLLATAGSDLTVRLWDPRTGQPVSAPLTGPEEPVDLVALSPDGTLVAAGSVNESTVYVWDRTTGSPVGAPLPVKTQGLAFSADGQLLATGGYDGTVRLWDPRTRRQIGPPLTGHTGPTWNTVVFSRDGSLLASADHDGAVRLWDPSAYRNPGPYLCARVGNPNEETWGRFAPGVPAPHACG